MNIKNIKTIMKKEFYRVFKDRRLLFTAVIMPGLLIYIMYTFMGKAMRNAYTTEAGYSYTVYTVNMPTELNALFADVDVTLEAVSDGKEAQDAKAKVAAKEKDLLVVFPEQFLFDIADPFYSGMIGQVVTPNRPVPNVELYYNSSRSESAEAFQMFCSILDAYEQSMVNKFDMNRMENEDTLYDLATKEDNYQQILSMLMPMLIMMFIFTGSMQIAPESIAGEKERGTIATILVTPVKRTELAIGKVVSLSVISMISGLSSFIGIIFSLPSLIGDGSSDVATLFSFKDYTLLLLIMLTTVLVIVSAISVISAYAKTIKEATSYLTPLMLLVTGVSLSGLFMKNAGEGSLLKFFVPILNSSQCLTEFFSFEYHTSGILITAAANVIFTALLVFGLARMLNSEKIIFAK